MPNVKIQSSKEAHFRFGDLDLIWHLGFGI
jgi:hypothetical protein